MVHKRQMLDGLWFSLLGGVLIGAVSLLVGGVPLAVALIREQRAVRLDLRRAIEGLENRQAVLSEAIEATDDRITSEVRRRASEKGVEARRAKDELEPELQAAVDRHRGVAPIRMLQGGPGLLRGGGARGPAA